MLSPQLGGVADENGSISYDPALHAVPVPEVTETVASGALEASPAMAPNSHAVPETEVTQTVVSARALPPLPKPTLPADVARALGVSTQPTAESGGERPVRIYHSDETGTYDGTITLDDGKHRPEQVYFCSPSDSVCEAIEEMPVEMARILGTDVEELATTEGLQKHMKAAKYERQLEAKRYMAGLYQRVRQEPNVIKSWTFQAANGDTKPITPESVEALPPDVKQMIAQGVVNYVLSSEKEQLFTLA